MATSRISPVMTRLPSIFYEDPEPVEDGMLQDEFIYGVTRLLKEHFRDAPGVFARGGGFVFYDPANGNRRVAPDLFIAFDVDVEGIRENKLPNYWIWEIGKPPDFVMEVASPSTAANDLGPKRALYERLGVQEYWRLDGSEGSELYGQPLAGERLVDGRYEPYELHTAEDGTIWAYSEALDLRFHWGLDLREQFDVRDPLTGRTIDREVMQREAWLAERLVEREGRLAAEARERGEREARLAEREARLAAEARERELLAEIERLRRRPPETLR